MTKTLCNVTMALGLIMALGVFVPPLAAQEKPLDRQAWYDGKTATSDDLRRVNVPQGFGAPEGSILIKNARLFDGTGAAARPAALLIESGRITQIEKSDSEITPPQNILVIDATGRTVMPGLIDLHTHLTYGDGGDATGLVGASDQAGAALRGTERLRYFIESGVTSIRDVGSDGQTPFTLKQWVYTGRIPGPRIFAAGSLITGIGGHGAEGNPVTAPKFPDATIYEASGADGFREAVRVQFKKGADLIKLSSHFTFEEVQAAVEEAHALGIKVTVDSETIYTERAVRAGADCIEHPLPRSDETIEMMARKGICADLTLVPYQYINAMGGYNFSTSRRFTLTDEANFAMARKLNEAGVTIGIGTDLVVGWYKFLPEPYLQELRNYKSLGYTPAEALVAATQTNSEILGMSDRLGTATVGKLADLIIVAGKPDLITEDLARVDMVIVNGRVVVSDGAITYPHHTAEQAPMTTDPAQ